MGELGGFIQVHRVGFDKRDPRERVRDYKQYFHTQPDEELRRQGGRCMDCGVPFCHEGCPLGNLIPDWNDLVYRGDWKRAIEQLHATNNFPEFTGLICPAPCESACVLDINDDPVTIEQIELGIIERAWTEGWVVAEPPEERTGKTIGVVGSGPAGLAVADQLNRAGHTVTVYERDEGPGGLLRFGVPDAKLEKWIIDRRVDVLVEEGVEFVYDCDIGRDLTAEELRSRHDAVVVAIGSRVHRDLEVPGRELEGVHFALDEGGKREWNAEVIELLGEDGRVTRARARRVEGTSSRDLRAVPGTEHELPADLVLIAIGFSHPEHEGLIEQLGIDLDARGNVKASVYETSAVGVFACGDARVGQSLVVTAIAEGRKCARMVDRHLMGDPEFELEPEDQATITDAHFLELEAQTAGNVTVSDEFFSGPGEPS